MLITPQDVREYTTSKKIKRRTDEQLQVDIYRAELKLQAVTGRKLDDPIFDPLPANVKIFLILWTEYYSLSADVESTTKKSETFDDYSYTNYNGVTVKEPESLDLIKDYIKDNGEVGTQLFMRMRRL